MTAIEQILTLKAKAEKELATLRKTRDAAKAKAEKALADFQAADKLFKDAEAALGVVPASTPEAPVPAPKAEKAPKAAKAAPAKAAKAPKATAAPEAPAPVGVRLKKDGTPAKRPGPPKGSTRGAKAAAPEAPKAAVPEAPKAATPAPVAKGKKAKAAATPAPAPEAPKAAVPTKKAPKGQKTRAAEGRRAVMSGERPTLKDAMRQVMGTATMNSAEVLAELQKKGWAPNSKDPKTYIGYSLSNMKKEFEPVPDKGRGYYRVRQTNGAVTQNGAAPFDMDQTIEDAKAILGLATN